MATVKYMLTSTPQNITTGTKTALIQVFKGKSEIRFAESATQPAKTIYQVAEGTMSFPAGFKLWAWSEEVGAELTVSEAGTY